MLSRQAYLLNVNSEKFYSFAKVKDYLNIVNSPTIQMFVYMNVLVFAPALQNNCKLALVLLLRSWIISVCPPPPYVMLPYTLCP